MWFDLDYHSSGLIIDLEFDKYNKSVYYLRKKF